MKRTLLALVAMLCLTFAASAADISGKWATDPAAAPAGGGGGRGGAATYTFKVEGSTLTGSVTRGQNDTAITEGKMDGDKLSFTVMQAGRGGGDPMPVKFTGVVKGDTIELTSDRGRGPMTTVLKKQ
jgi:opacity protein-like surface antigen